MEATTKMQHASKFIRVRCAECNNEQIIFNKLSTEAKCLVCQKVLAKSTGGKADITAAVIEVLN